MWLADGRYGKNRMAFLVSMLRMTAMAGYESAVNNIKARVNVGQVERSEVQLAKDWNCDRKTVARVIGMMNKLGIITTEKSNRTSVHTINIVAAWVVDDVRIRNPNFKTDYDWHSLRKGGLTDVVPNVTFGQPVEQHCRNGKGNVHSGSSLGGCGSTFVLPTVEGLEMLEVLSGKSLLTDDDSTASNGEEQHSANVEIKPDVTSE